MLNSTTADTAETTYAKSAYEEADASQSFDNLDDLPNESMENNNEEDWSKADDSDKETIKKQTSSKKTAEDVSDELKLLSDSDQTEEDAKPKPKKEEDKEEEDKEVEVSGEADEKDLPKDGKGKLKVRVDGELFSLDSTATLRHKIDGEWQDIPVMEALSSYSSKVVREKAFEEVQVKQKELKVHTQKLEGAKQKIRDLIDPVIGILQDETKDPYEALQFLVDKIGGDPQKLYKRTIEANLGELSKLLDMSEIERENYFVKKEVEFLKARDSRRAQSDKEAMEVNTHRAKVDRLREEFSVSEADFVDAVDELEQLYGEDFKKLDEPFMVRYAAQRPHIKKVQELARPYVDEIGESKISDLVGKLSHGLWQGDFTEAQVKSHLRAKYGVSDGLRELNRKMSKTGAREIKAKESEESERVTSFDDLLD